MESFYEWFSHRKEYQEQGRVVDFIIKEVKKHLEEGNTETLYFTNDNFFSSIIDNLIWFPNDLINNLKITIEVKFEDDFSFEGSITGNSVYIKTSIPHQTRYLNSLRFNLSIYLHEKVHSLQSDSKRGGVMGSGKSGVDKIKSGYVSNYNTYTNSLNKDKLVKTGDEALFSYYTNENEVEAYVSQCYWLAVKFKKPLWRFMLTFIRNIKLPLNLSLKIYEVWSAYARKRFPKGKLISVEEMLNYLEEAKNDII